MKISLEWLSEFVAWNETDPRIIADTLTLSTAEVEEVEMKGEFLNECCVGKILTVARHPDADRLNVCTVETDKGVKNVVCGGTNVREGMLIAFAHVGATVKWHGGEVMTLTPVKIRGVQSEGMICAAEELGLDSMYQPQKEDGERPIMDLSRLTSHFSLLTTGASLKEALGQSDSVLHINNTAITTRPDLFSHLGFARECVALGLAKWKKAGGSRLEAPKGKKGNALKLSLDAHQLVPRYLACTIEIDGLGETPAWMKQRLESVGLRLVNLPVDITNYVMNEYGVPMHSFDADDVSGNAHLRLTKKGEKLMMLDGNERALPENVLVISDDKGVFDLVGIMGGLRSSTKDSTKRIYLHALSLDSAVIRRAILGTAHRTDAATIYEKGVPPATAEQGFNRAVALFLELIPGARIVSSITDEGSNGKPKAIETSVDEINATLGTDIAEKTMINILEDLEFEVKKKAKTLSVTPPLHRLRDVSGSHDIVEEIGRINGYDDVEPVMPVAAIRLPAREKRVHAMRDALKEAGFIECMPLSLVSPSVLQKAKLPVDIAISVKNPLGEETSLLQPHTLPQLLAQAGSQLSQSSGDLLTFQSGRIFQKDAPERVLLTALITAKTKTDLLHDPFLRVKTAIVSALKDAGYEADVIAGKSVPPFAHPGRVAYVNVDGAHVGTVCEIHPSVCTAFDLPFRAAAATVDVTALLQKPATITKEKPRAQFPAVSYDVTLPRTQSDVLGPLLGKARAASTLLEHVEVADIYDGQPLKDGAYNLTLRFTYRAPDRTLTDDEVKKEHEKVLKAVA